MRASKVSYAQKNCGVATEKLAFECNKRINAALTNAHQQNPSMTSGIIFIVIPDCTFYYLLYQEFRIVCTYP